ncbi:MFS transporter [Bacillus benzoevorans]|uniref:MFS family permease n=1 Tax=Bacillus benzoevorans TaxID=1456 RepID=A0A7X0LV85_9BACI|nr:MFS transporter [Bacillus benzoevorans]MBB6444312.1 MFS family permease [Bacillus benzoevorans]
MQTQTIRQEKLWTAHFMLIFIYSLFTSIANGMLMTGLPLYAIHLGGDNSVAGMLWGLFMLFAILFRPFFGKLIDEKSRRLVLIIGGVISAFISLSYVLAFSSLGILLLLRSLHGIGFSATTNASGTIVSDIVPKSRLAEGVGYFGLSNTIATAIGPAFCLYLIHQYSYNLVFIVTSFIGFIALGCSFFIRYEKKSAEHINRTKPKGKRSLADLMVEKTALPSALVTTFVFVAVGSAISFIPIYAQSLEIEDIGLYFTVSSIALLITRLFAGKIADNYGPAFVIIPGLILLVLSFVLLAYATSLTGMLISGVLYGLGLGSSDPTINAVMIRVCPVDRRGAGNSTLFLAKDIGGGIGAVALGFVSLHTGFRFVFLICSLSIVLSFIAYQFVLRKQINSIRKLEEAANKIAL